MDTALAVIGWLIVVVLLFVLIFAVVGLVTRRRSLRVIVHDYERGLRYQNGAFHGLLGPGAYWTISPGTEIRVIDSRPTDQTIEGQEVLSADGVAVKLSFVARYVVSDPAAMVLADQNPLRALYLRLQLAIREVVSPRTLEEILAARTEIGPAVAARCSGPLAQLGIDLLSVDVRDVMIPGELKRAFAAVIAARREGAASLERARGETAALRSLANAGRLVDDNPGLLSLRVIQEIGASSGNTVVFGAPSIDGTGGAGAKPATTGRAGPRGRGGRADATPGAEPASGD